MTSMMMKKRMAARQLRLYRNQQIRRNLRANLRRHHQSQSRLWLLLHPLQPQLSLLTPVPLSALNML